VFPRAAKWLIVLMLVTVTGTHWMLLQSVAWVGMAVSFARTESLPVALEKTFDGRHPCQLCKAVAEGKQHESKQEARQPGFKLELFCEAKPVRLDVPPLVESPFPFTASHANRCDVPPVPPPRRA
jgi:hypothetical protein